MIQMDFLEFKNIVSNGKAWKAKVSQYAITHRKVVLQYCCVETNSYCFAVSPSTYHINGPLDWTPSYISLQRTQQFDDWSETVYSDGDFSIKSNGGILFLRDEDFSEELLTSFDFGQYSVWAFIEANSKYPCGIFETKNSAKNWIAKEKMTGNLISYPVGGPTQWIDYDGLKLDNKEDRAAAIATYISKRQDNIHFDRGIEKFDSR